VVDARPRFKAGRGHKGFDFRAVPLDEKTIGTDEECVVGRVEKLESGFRVQCESHGEAAYVDVIGAEGIARDDVVMLRIEAAGEKPVSAKTRFVEKIGELPAPEPPSRCCRDRDRDHPPGYEPKPLPEAYDFGKVAEKDWGKDKVCQVGYVGDVEKTDPSAARYEMAATFAPEDAGFVVDLLCAHAGGSERVLVGARSYHELLHVKRDSYVMLRLWRTGRHDATAMFLRPIYTER
jgi:hypothetical protein